MIEHTKNGCNCTPNRASRCSVEKCANHCVGEAYCGLDSIQVGTHEANPTVFALPPLPENFVSLFGLL